MVMKLMKAGEAWCIVLPSGKNVCARSSDGMNVFFHVVIVQKTYYTREKGKHNNLKLVLFPDQIRTSVTYQKSYYYEFLFFFPCISELYPEKKFNHISQTKLRVKLKARSNTHLRVLFHNSERKFITSIKPPLPLLDFLHKMFFR